jgi:hypothetical protein
MFLKIPEEWNLHQPVHKPTPLAISSTLNSPSTNEYGGSMFLQHASNLPPGYTASHP